MTLKFSNKATDDSTDLPKTSTIKAIETSRYWKIEAHELHKNNLGQPRRMP